MKKITFFTFCLTLFLASNLYSKTVWVSAVAKGSADGTTAGNAYGDFAVALATIVAGDILRVSSGSGPVTVNASSANWAAKNFAYTIQGDLVGSTLVKSGGVGARIITLNSAAVGLNVTFKYIIFTGSTDVTIAGGGAVLLTNQPVTLNFENCRFEGNSLAATVLNGGAALNVTNSTVTLTDCLFKENTALRNGGAISMLAGNLTMTRCTFYKNKTTTDGTTTSPNTNSLPNPVGGGAALYVTGASTTVNVSNCTFFQNTTGNTNQDYGTIRSDNGNTTVTNSLFYDNKTNNDAGETSDWGAATAGTQTFTYSIGQWITNNIDTRTNFISFVKNNTVPNGVAANLTSSNLTYDNASGFVKYTDPAPGGNTPISFGNDGKDAGAWNSPNTWTGTTSTSWTDATNWSIKGVPDATKDALIAAAAPANQPIIGSTVSIASLTLNASTSLTVSSGFNLTVAGAVANSGTMTLENNANLIQGGTTNTNTGNVIVKRNSNPLLRLDYTLWSSPVANQNLLAFSPATTTTRFYNYNTVTNLYNAEDSANSFTVGKGYLIRMPNNANEGTSTAYPGVFTGVPHNGAITVNLSGGGADGFRYNLVGNPYPSPINIWTFVSENTASIESTLYFWRKTNGLVGQTSAYCTFIPGALIGDPGTFASNSNAQSVDPAGVIGTGQGFFVAAKSGATTLTFNNTQRVNNTVGQFFRTKEVAEPSKIWLNATNAAGDFSQMAVTYFDGATKGIDAFDAKYINDSDYALTSDINQGEYTIQGRPAFDVSDVVALNFKTNAEGDYTIAIDHFEGVFTAGQDVYLVDSKTGAETDLKASSYTFAAIAGMDNTRFSLKYQKTLKVDAPAFNENSVSVYKNNGTIYVNSGKIAINSIQVYDVQGRLIAERKNVKSSTATLENLKANNQVLLVKISGEDNSVVTKKVVN